MDETSKVDSSKLAFQITGNRGDDPKEEFYSHSGEPRGSNLLQFLDRFMKFKKLFSWLRYYTTLQNKRQR